MKPLEKITDSHGRAVTATDAQLIWNLNAAITRINELTEKIEKLEGHRHSYTHGWIGDTEDPYQTRATSQPLSDGDK